MQDLERQRLYPADAAPTRSALTYGPTGAPERQPVPVPVQTTPLHRPLPDRQPMRAVYDDQDLEIPSFLRRPPQDEKG
jgi:hypothetical protein